MPTRQRALLLCSWLALGSAAPGGSRPVALVPPNATLTPATPAGTIFLQQPSPSEAGALLRPGEDTADTSLQLVPALPPVEQAIPIMNIEVDDTGLATRISYAECHYRMGIFPGACAHTHNILAHTTPQATSGG